MSAALAIARLGLHVPVFVKQMGDNPLNGGQHPRYLAHHGADPGEWPRSLQRQEFPR